MLHMSRCVVVPGGWLRGDGRAADLRGVRSAQRQDGGDSGRDGRTGTLPRRVLYGQRPAGQPGTAQLLNPTRTPHCGYYDIIFI